jgi:ParB family chromosome partitioning protein
MGEARDPMTDEQKAERREVIENNKAWKSATTVRREWLKTFVARKTAPNGVERFVLSCLLAGDHVIKQAIEAHHPMLRELLGLASDEATPTWDAGRQEINQLIQQVPGYSPKRAMVLTAALLLAAWEAKTGTHTWRNPSSESRLCLGQMVEWGYEASEVEQLVLTLPEEQA